MKRALLIVPSNGVWSRVIALLALQGIQALVAVDAIELKALLAENSMYHAVFQDNRVILGPRVYRELDPVRPKCQWHVVTVNQFTPEMLAARVEQAIRIVYRGEEVAA